MSNNFEFLDMLHSMNSKDYVFFKQIVRNTEDDLFLSSEKKDKIQKEIGIGETTYFKRLKSLVGLGVLKMSSKGVYRLSDNWMKLLTLDVKVIGAERHSIKTNQKLVNLKF